jgi:hypothetical protein
MTEPSAQASPPALAEKHAGHTYPDFMPPRLLNTGIALVCDGGLLLLALCAIAACRAHRHRVECREEQRLAIQHALAETSDGRV